MGAAIEPGDTLTVLELGGCTSPDGDAWPPESVTVSVGGSGEPLGEWAPLGTGEGPEVRFTVPALPPLPPQ